MTREKNQLDYRVLLAECELRESLTKETLTQYLEEHADLTRKLGEAQARIIELETELTSEKKLHWQANMMRIQQQERDTARIAWLKDELDGLKDAVKTSELLKLEET